MERPADGHAVAGRERRPGSEHVQAGALLGPSILADRTASLRESIGGIIGRVAFQPVFQPIVELETRTVLGYEALTRFDDAVPPDRRIADAATVGLGADLELACLEAAITVGQSLPGDAWLSLNVSPATVLETHRLNRILDAANRPIVVELTEHVPVADYAALRAATDLLRPRARIAIDDAGAGYASFRHIVELQPDFVKLDIGLVRSIDEDRATYARLNAEVAALYGLSNEAYAYVVSTFPLLPEPLRAACLATGSTPPSR